VFDFVSLLVKHSACLVWFVGLAVGLLVRGVICCTEKDLSAELNNPPNSARTYGTGKYVSDIRVGWCNNDGQIIEHNPFTQATE
jgi:hypothetical protein